MPPPSRARAHPTLDQQEPVAEALELDPADWSHGHAVVDLATEHPHVRAWPEGNPDLAHELNHRDWNHAHDHSLHERAAEQAFNRLNPDFGVPADRSHRIGHHDAQQREAALALGVRVAMHDSRQNDPDPIIGSPARTTEPPRPSRPPAAISSGPVVGRSGPARSAESA